MSFGEDLSLGMLEDNVSIGDDFIISSEMEGLSQDLDEMIEPQKGTKGEQQIEGLKETTSENIKEVTGEEDIPESVASEEGNKKETPDATTSSPKVDDNTSKLYSSLAAQLHETGVLPSLEDSSKITSWEQLQEAVKKEIDNGRSENERAYMEAINRGEPADVYLKYKKADDDLNSISEEQLNDPESSQLRFNILAQDFLNKGFDREEAIKHAQRSVDLGEDIADAKMALGRLIEFNRQQYQNTVEQIKKQQEESVNKVKQFIDSTDEIVKGVKLTPSAKEQLFNQMTKSVGLGKNGKPVTAYGKALNEDTLRVRTITEYLFMATKGFTDFSKLTNVIESKAISNFDNILKSSGSGFLENGRPNLTDDESSFLIGDNLKFDI